MGKKLTYEYVKEYVESFGFKLISKEYIGSNTKMEFKCPEGHEFLMIWSNFQQGSRCPICNNKKKKFTYEYIKEYIENFGYKLLSIKYNGAIEKLKYMCPLGHKFLMTWSHFQQGIRCPICAGNKKLTYGQVKKYVESFGFKLISKKYNNVKTKMKYRCPKGHEFLMTYNNFQQGRRCPICANIKPIGHNIKLTYEQVKEYIENFEGYKLLSKEYTNNHTKMKYRCPKGHEFLMTYNNFKTGNRCPECFGTKKLTYEYVKEYIESFGYKLLSLEYINAKTKLKLQCPESHEFLMTWDNFKHNHRCPQCYFLSTSSKGEKEVCEYVKSLTKELILENDRTQIVNPLTGHNLELDIYIPSLNKAIEFNSEYFHSETDVIIRDKEKVRQCKEKNIDLLVMDWEKWESCQEWCMEIIKNFIEENNE